MERINILVDVSFTVGRKSEVRNVLQYDASAVLRRPTVINADSWQVILSLTRFHTLCHTHTPFHKCIIR